MKNIPTLCVLCLLLSACGPREIGEGYASDSQPIPEATAADNMRMPVIGMSNNEQLLHYYNRQDVMENIRQGSVRMLQRGHAISPEDPAYRAVPKQRSPFRQ